VPRGGGHRRRERRLLAEIETAIRPRRPATLLGYTWWWRYELGIAVGLTLTLNLLVSGLGLLPTVIGTLATVGICSGWPPARNATIAAAWRIITPHRLRAGFVQARIHSRNGRLPTILRTSRQPFGEQVRLWCPAGISVADLRSARAMLAAACWAAEVRVTTDSRHAHLVTLDVIRLPDRGPGSRDGPGTPRDQFFRNEDPDGWPTLAKGLAYPAD
jgi:hypothetical protein